VSSDSAAAAAAFVHYLQQIPSNKVAQQMFALKFSHVKQSKKYIAVCN